MIQSLLYSMMTTTVLLQQCGKHIIDTTTEMETMTKITPDGSPDTGGGILTLTTEADNLVESNIDMVSIMTVVDLSLIV